MRMTISAICIGFVLVVSAAIQAEDLPRVSPQSVLERSRQSDQSMIILDVRTPAEYAQGHVPGAINIPHDKLADRIQELMTAKDKEIVVYCRSGRRAESAAVTLSENGFEKVLRLDGHMLKWMEAKLPTSPPADSAAGSP